MDAIRQFWAERAPRERSIIAAAGAVMVLVVGYLVLIEPAWTGITRLERTLPQLRANAAELESLLSEVRALRSRAGVASISGAEARGAIDTSLARSGVKAARVVPLADGDMQLTFSDVSFGHWAPWLAGIERELGARATAVNITGRDATPGNVDVELALRLARK
jgi:general secretion pathway protein M